MTSKPNIIYILADDMGYGDLGANNPDSKIPTPNLDRLACRGMRFTDAHAASSVCTPSRYSILTGRYCWRTPLKRSVLWEWDAPLIESDRPTVAKLLRDNGYRTTAIGKWHLGWDWTLKNGEPAGKYVQPGQMIPDNREELAAQIDYTQPLRGGPVDCGFENYFGIDVPNFPPYTWFVDDRLDPLPTEDKPQNMFGHAGKMAPGWSLEAMLPAFAKRACDYIEQSGEKPFFMYLAITSPHTPICPNEEFIGRSGAGRYGDFVCETDWVVGQVMDAVDAKGIAEDTLIIFTSDNGPECIPAAAGGTYEHAREFHHYSMGELRGVKRDTWEGGHRVPFIASWPSVVPAEQTCSQLTCLGDFIATCADLINAELPEGQAEDSLSALPLLRGENIPCRESLVHHSGSGKFAIRKGHWVFIDNPTGDDNQEPEWFKQERGYVPHDLPGELFDLREDLSERTNLYGEHPEVVEELAGLLAAIKGNDVEDIPPAPGPGSE